jgi:hypothetical protein
MPEDGKCYLSRLDPARCCKSSGGEGGLFHQDITQDRCEKLRTLSNYRWRVNLATRNMEPISFRSWPRDSAKDDAYGHFRTR